MNQNAFSDIATKIWGSFQTPDRKSRSRPGSLVLSSESTLPLPNNRERSLTADSLKFISLQPPPPPPHAPKSKGKN